MNAKARKLERYIFIDYPEEKVIEVKPYYKHELATIYNVGYNTFTRWLRPFEADLIPLGYRRQQKILTVEQVRVVFDRLGEP